MRFYSIFITTILISITILFSSITQNKLNENQLLKKQLVYTQEYYKSFGSVKRIKNLLDNNIGIENEIVFNDLEQNVKVEKIRDIDEYYNIQDLSLFSIPQGSSIIVTILKNYNRPNSYYSFSLIDTATGNILYNAIGSNETKYEINDLRVHENLKIDYVLSQNLSINVQYKLVRTEYKIIVKGKDGFIREYHYLK